MHAIKQCFVFVLRSILLHATYNTANASPVVSGCTCDFRCNAWQVSLQSNGYTRDECLRVGEHSCPAHALSASCLIAGTLIVRQLSHVMTIEPVLLL
jgi:hypothetical protein